MERAKSGCLHSALACLLVCGVLAAAASRAQAVDKVRKPRVLFVPLSDLPPRASESMRDILASRSQMLSTSSYMRSAAKRGMRYGSVITLKRLGRRGEPDVIVVAGIGSMRANTVVVTYRSGKTIGKLQEAEYPLDGQGDLTAKGRAGVLQVLAQATGASPAPQQPVRLDEVTIVQVPAATPKVVAGAKPAPAAAKAASAEAEQVGPPAPTAEEAATEEAGEPTEAEAAADEEVAAEEETPAEGEEGALVLNVGAGFGVGQRLIRLPTASGTIGLSTAPFAAARADFTMGFRLKGTRSRLGLIARYDTSIVLKLTEQFPDGTTRSVDARSQDASAAIYYEVKWWNTPRSPWVHMALAGDMRLFTPEQNVSVPKNLLISGALRLGLFFRVGSGPLVFGVVPEGGAVVYVSDQLKNQGVDSLGYMVGGEVHTRYEIKRHFHIGFFYRESHAFLGTDQADGFRDAMRYVVLTAAYAL